MTTDDHFHQHQQRHSSPLLSPPVSLRRGPCRASEPGLDASLPPHAPPRAWHAPAQPRPSEVGRGGQRSSEVIRGHQRSSEVGRGHQRSSVALTCSVSVGLALSRSSEVISGHQRSSVALTCSVSVGLCTSSVVISGHQRSSVALTCSVSVGLALSSALRNASDASACSPRALATSPART